MSASRSPSRGELWVADLDPPRGHEQGRTRPCLVVSVDRFNRGASGMVVIVPLTSRRRDNPLHVQIDPPDGGVRVQSFAKCEDVRAISTQRLSTFWGSIDATTMQQVEDRLRIILGL